MSATFFPALPRSEAEIPLPDGAWRALVTEAAAAAGISRARPRRISNDTVRDPRLGIADPDDRVADATRDVRRHCTRLRIAADRDAREPDEPAFARLDGALLRGVSVHKVATRVDLDANELGLTCQVGRFRMHAEAQTRCSAEHQTGYGVYNVARAGLSATIPGRELAGAVGGRVHAAICVPLAYDNTLQRVWRLAVPSRDMLVDPSAPHFAVVGLRGWATMSLMSPDGQIQRDTVQFLSRSLSAHAPKAMRGRGAIRGAHPLEVPLPTRADGDDVTLTITVTLAALAAGDFDAYSPDAPFFAGADFGAGGGARYPGPGVDAFRLPLTPLTDNEPVSVSCVTLSLEGD